MALVCDRVAFFKLQVVDALHQIHLLIGTGGELIVVRVVKGLRESVAETVLIADGADLCLDGAAG